MATTPRPASPRVSGALTTRERSFSSLSTVLTTVSTATRPPIPTTRQRVGAAATRLRASLRATCAAACVVTGTTCGAIAGAIVGYATARGAVRGAVRGALAGATTALETFDADAAEAEAAANFHFPEFLAASRNSSSTDSLSSLSGSGDVVVNGGGDGTSSALAVARPELAMFTDEEGAPRVLQLSFTHAMNFIQALRAFEDESARKGAASDAAIGALPRRVIARGDEGLGVTCAVCLESHEIGQRVVGLPCGHDFHGSCVERWLKRRDCCPVCRRSIVRDSAAKW